MPYRARVRKNGQITIPHKIRKEFGTVEGTIIEFTVEDSRIILRPLPPEKSATSTSKPQLLTILKEIGSRPEKRKVKISSTALIREDRERQEKF